MLLVLVQVVTLVILAIPMSTVVAHALELPGKRRLGREDYLTVQGIYYPGFTRAGIGEPVAILALVLLLFLTPASPAFWLTAGALAAIAFSNHIYRFGGEERDHVPPSRFADVA